MKRIKNNYLKSVKIDGAHYDFRFWSDEKLQRLWDNNPQLRYLFEDDEAEEQLKELGIETPEQFEEIVKEVVKAKKPKKK